MNQPILLLLRAIVGHYRNHPWQLLLMWVGIAVGVATIIGVELLNDSARRSIASSQQQLTSGASHIIEGDALAVEQTYRRIQREIPGLKATPLLRIPLTDPDTGHQLELLGIDPITLFDLQPNFNQESSFQVNPEELIPAKKGLYLDQATARMMGWATGQERILEGPLGSSSLRLLKTFDSIAVSMSANKSIALMDIGKAMSLFTKAPAITQIRLKLDDATLQQVEDRMVAPARLRALENRVGSLLKMRQSFELSLNALSAMALLMGLFLVYNSSHFGFLQRQPLLAQLRSMGVSSRQIGTCLSFEYAVLAISASLCAVPLGWLLAHQLASLMSAGHMAGGPSAILLNANNLIIAILIGCLASFAACLLPLVSAPKTGARPFGSAINVSNSKVHHPRWQPLAAIGLLSTAGLLLSLPHTSIMVSYGAISLLLLGLALLTPLILASMLSLLERSQKTANGRHWLPLLLIRETLRNLGRTRVALMALMVAVATSFGMQLMIDSFRGSVEQWLDQRLNAPVYLRMASQNQQLRPDIAPALLTELGGLERIDFVSEFSFQKLWIQDRQVEAMVNNFPPPSREGYLLLEDNGQPPWPQLNEGPATLVSEPLAYHLNISVGDSITTEINGEAVSLSVIGIFQDYGSEQGRLLLGKPFYQTLTSTSRIRALGLYTGMSLEALRQQLGNRWLSRIELIDQQGLKERSLAVFDQTFAITSALQLLAIMVAFMGLFASLLAILMERKQQMRVFHQLGLTSLERGCLLMGEGMIIGIAAGVLAIPGGEILAWILLKVINLKAFGWNLDLIQHNMAWLHPILLSCFAAFLATLYPAWRLAGPPPQSEEAE
ncbi:FtsX-like permease family protein [Aestuariirhabdus sp. Z084]|uniref:FtsX-like permease family protein n=1 Tax=Aestuariirhabdus haliotis TaxID=2918751 RepID=UPI00201B4321|nr:FtsX-like permease family protein [Aestuariirhabdus haliotis]MCL6414428.1 FtsX-like permease family protein [Aestuariirhabdus haliotis]MCL6418590.1 FtsX-like permease family protein [Aestuariirhabdus haliotis]